MQYHNINTKDNPSDVSSCSIDLKRNRERIDLWLHGPELLSSPDLWESLDSLPQEIMVLNDDEQPEIPEQKVVVHVIDRCIARYSTHKRVYRMIAILFAFRQFWIVMLCTKQWQTSKIGKIRNITSKQNFCEIEKIKMSICPYSNLMLPSVK